MDWTMTWQTGPWSDGLDHELTDWTMIWWTRPWHDGLNRDMTDWTMTWWTGEWHGRLDNDMTDWTMTWQTRPWPGGLDHDMMDWTMTRWTGPWQFWLDLDTRLDHDSTDWTTTVYLTGPRCKTWPWQWLDHDARLDHNWTMMQDWTVTVAMWEHCEFAVIFTALCPALHVSLVPTVASQCLALHLKVHRKQMWTDLVTPSYCRCYLCR